MSRVAVKQLGLLRSQANALLRPTSALHSGFKAGQTRPRAVGVLPRANHAVSQQHLQTRSYSSAAEASSSAEEDKEERGSYSEAHNEHAVISTFDLFSIGIGPSSSHTVGPMRAGNIFISDLIQEDLLHKVAKIRVAIYGSLALTGEGHMTPSALLLGLESADVETVDTAYVPDRFEEIKASKKIHLGHHLPGNQGKEIDFDYEVDFKWEWGKKLPLHSNGMRLMVFDEEGYMLASNDLFSVGGGFVVNGAMSTAKTAAAAAQAGMALEVEGGKHPEDLAENMFYKEIRRDEASADRRAGSDPENADGLVASEGGSTGVGEAQQEKTAPTAQPSYPFHDGRSLLDLCSKHNLTIAQIVYENEKSHGYTDEEVLQKTMRIWEVMDNSILEGVQAPLDSKLPGSLKMHRRAPALYRRLTRGLYPSHTSQQLTGDTQETIAAPQEKPQLTEPGKNGPPPKKVVQEPKALSTRKSGPPRVHGSFYHPIMPHPQRRTALPVMDYLNVYAMAVNETNAAGGRIVTAPTNGAAGIIPAVLKYTLEFISDDPERDTLTFLLTAAAIGMLYKRGATISAAEGGCMAEVGVACSMAAGAFAACMGASPEVIEQAAEIGIEHNLGLTCDPIGGLVQAPCIERNALGAIKAISSANLALSGESGTQKVSLDNAIRAMRLTAEGMRNEFKETSLSGLATSVPFNIPVSVPDC